MASTFNYGRVFYSCFCNGSSSCIHRSGNYAVNYVYSGEMIIDDGKERIRVAGGEAVFIPRDHRLTICKNPCGGEQYVGIYIMFTRDFLREMYDRYGKGKVDGGTAKMPPEVIKLPSTPPIQSLFASMTPYFDQNTRPSDDFMNLKMQEALIALLNVDRRFATLLFDFKGLWKIDIIEFMNRNYMYDFSVEELANYTGRSLSAFKRDFKKVSGLSPERWLVRKRLEEAYGIITQKRDVRISDVSEEVGFKNPAHFSTAFKKQYGVTPSSLTAARHNNMPGVGLGEKQIEP